MAYKTRFQPLEALGPGGWTTMAPAPAIPDPLLLSADAAD